MVLYAKSRVDRVRDFLKKSPTDHQLPTWKRLVRVAVRLTYIVGVLFGILLSLYVAVRALRGGTYYVYAYLQPFYDWAHIREQAEGVLSLIIFSLIFIPIVWAVVWEYKRKEA